MKQVLTVQDLSCMGKCSLTVAQPVISAMGCGCAVLPTAVLSTHTAFPDPYVRELTGDMDGILRHWQSVGAGFDAVSVGYLSDPAQAEAAGRVLDAFAALSVIDPVMGDNGRLYSRITQDHVTAMKALCKKGAVLLPNVTEAAALTGIGYRASGDAGYYRALLEGLKTFGSQAVIITGTGSGNITGFTGWGREAGFFAYETERLPRQCHGTGDLFAAVVTGGLALGKSVPQAAELAAGFVEQVLDATPEASAFGVNFESCLPWLWKHL